MGKKKIAEQGTQKEAQSAAVSSVATKKAKRVEAGRVYIKASYNNTVVSVTDLQGNVIGWASAGSLGFSGPKKATPFASSKVIAALTERLKANGLKDIEVFTRGVGSGRDAALRSLVGHGFNVLSLKDVTGVPHNGPRPKKVRRV